MHQRKSKQITIYFFFLFLLGSITNVNFQDIQILNMNKIKVSGLDEKSKRELFYQIDNLKFKNIFFLNEDQI